MKLLKEYYDKRIKKDGMPEFKELSGRDVTLLRSSIGFAGFQVKKSVEEFHRACRLYVEKHK
ncbi:hypothetical protein MHM83_10965 [Tenacibaculum sp. Mcav3-52]|uniref:hypothetical protein n=1 Tax=Tenacibaculum sp. Mcav3-52 TaxID=2917762 RepID=UPI001EF1F5C7|nr:hypothetical protein [Tenacibaculum sp. Mcav3-52]MCG7502393.1 hypothetical protein [Tenacibaculum sp. Mcav3-52]